MTLLTLYKAMNLEMNVQHNFCFETGPHYDESVFLISDLTYSKESKNRSFQKHFRRNMSVNISFFWIYKFVITVLPYFSR